MRATVLAWFLIAASCALASLPAPPSLNDIQREIDRKGPRETARHLYADKVAWKTLTNSVAAGRAPWIDLAILLRTGSDGGASSELEDAMFQALAENPRHVLMSAGRSVPLKTLCSGRSDPLATRNQALAEIARVQAAVKRVNENQVAQQRMECLAALEEAKANTERFFKD